MEQCTKECGLMISNMDQDRLIGLTDRAILETIKKVGDMVLEHINGQMEISIVVNGLTTQ